MIQKKTPFASLTCHSKATKEIEEEHPQHVSHLMRMCSAFWDKSGELQVIKWGLKEFRFKNHISPKLLLPAEKTLQR